MIYETVRDAGLLADGRPVVIMFSGGRDSTCLLDLAVRIAGVQAVSAVHANYGLRGAADADEHRESGRAVDGRNDLGRGAALTGGHEQEGLVEVGQGPSRVFYRGGSNVSGKATAWSEQAGTVTEKRVGTLPEHATAAIRSSPWVRARASVHLRSYYTRGLAT